jgi:thiosulfate dehydrogenase
MSRIQNRILFVIAASSLAVGVLGVSAAGPPAPAGSAPVADVNVTLCDGEAVMRVPGLKPGEVLPPDRAKEVAGQMLQSWRRSQGEARWAAWSRNVPADTGGVDGQVPAAAPLAQAVTPQPTKFTARDLQLWQREEKKWIDEGYKNYHNAKALGGTIGISCDMCHPDGSNTHPETYPKFQSQTKKVALLRDMINWCIENPLKGKPLAENDPVLRSLEAYILSTRKGTPLEAGKH